MNLQVSKYKIKSSSGYFVTYRDFIDLCKNDSNFRDIILDVFKQCGVHTQLGNLDFWWKVGPVVKNRISEGDFEFEIGCSILDQEASYDRKFSLNVLSFYKEQGVVVVVPLPESDDKRVNYSSAWVTLYETAPMSLSTSY